MQRTLLWARHGQNRANVTNTLSHRTHDPDLTERGVREAHALAERLAGGDDAVGRDVRTIVCSPLRRAQVTADVVAVRLGLTVVAVLEDLREVNVGRLDGRGDDAAWATYHRVLAAWAAGDLDERFPGGESGVQLVARLRRGLHRAADVGGSGSVLVVAHGANLRSALPYLTTSRPPAADVPTGGLAAFTLHASGELELSHWD